MDEHELIEKLEMVIKKLKSKEWIFRNGGFYFRKIENKNKVPKYYISLNTTVTEGRK